MCTVECIIALPKEEMLLATFFKGIVGIKFQLKCKSIIQISKQDAKDDLYQGLFIHIPFRPPRSNLMRRSL
jgi:hypothetical protein